MRIIAILLIIVLLLTACKTGQVIVEKNQTGDSNVIVENQTHPGKLKTVQETAIENCLELCLRQKQKNISLENGPCLSEEIITDWVCDVAHNPRIDLDNKPENQCSSFRDKKTHHFVEADVNCQFIKFY
jgi:hypothetical protein